MFFFITIFSSIIFLIYGLLCLFTNHMSEEFKRYGLSQFRLLVGTLELLGGLGLIVGYYYHDYIFLLSSVGLSLLMLLGVGVRLKIKDEMINIFPAFILMILNIVISYQVILNLLQ